jgi:hypothetical protein
MGDTTSTAATMPSETITGVVGSVVGAALVIVGSVYDTKVDAAVAGAITTLVSWLAFGVTLMVRMRRAGAQARARSSLEQIQASAPHEDDRG